MTGTRVTVDGQPLDGVPAGMAADAVIVTADALADWSIWQSNDLPESDEPSP